MSKVRVSASAMRNYGFADESGIVFSGQGGGDNSAVFARCGWVSREVCEEALEAGRGRLGAALRNHLDMDEADGPLDGDEDINRAPVEAVEMLEVDMDVAERGRFEGYCVPVRGRSRRCRHSAAHRLEDAIDRQAEPGAQLHRDLFLHRVEAGLQPLRPGRFKRRWTDSGRWIRLP